MSIRTWIVANIAARMTSEATEARRREEAERARARSGAPHLVEYFHQADDPYSHLTAQVLPLLADRYDVELRCYLVSPPADWAAPDRERLIGHSRIDAARLAHKAGLRFEDIGRQPEIEAVKQAESQLAWAIADRGFIASAARIGDALWSDRTLVAADAGDAEAARTEGDARRASLGHYLGATFYYGGEWCWGLDRLHYLESRLAGLGLRRPGAPAAPIFSPPDAPRLGLHPRADGAIDFFVSYRSPYTYLATERVKALADAYGAELRIRFVLPMVMRGLPVPPAKGRYITMDAAREARRLGIPFGRIADPVGKPVERGYSILPWAMQQGRGYEFCLSFMRAVWSEGVDAGSDAGLRQIVETAGLDWTAAKSRIGNDDWRAEAEANRLELLALGQWGVPCFRYGDTVTWGQDRLWVIEDAMRARLHSARNQ